MRVVADSIAVGRQPTPIGLLMVVCRLCVPWPVRETVFFDIFGDTMLFETEDDALVYR